MSLIGRASQFLASAVGALYATWNPADKSSGVTLASSDLNVTFSSVYNLVRATKGKSADKWYWEVTVNTASQLTIGVANTTESITAGGTWVGISANSWGWFNANGFLYTNNTAVYNVGTFANGNVLGFALDMDAGTITFYKNNVSVGSFSGLTGTIYPAVGTFNSTTSACTANFGATAFTYTPPTGHIALT